MNDYIDREAARKAVCERCDYFGIEADECRECNNPADEIPTADVVPVRRGKWVREDNGPFADTFHCSNCLNSPLSIYDAVLSDYCPYCGADMRKEDGNGKD